MYLKGIVQAATSDSYQGKNGQVNTFVLTVIDRTEQGRCKQTVDLMLTKDQSEKLSSHDPKAFEDKPIEVGVTEIVAMFGGRPRVRGSIVSLKV